MGFLQTVRKSAWKRAQTLLLLAALVISLQPGPALASDSTAANAGMGAAAALTSLLYGPAKIVYATLGLVIGGIAYGLSGGDPDVADAILLPAVRGDYVVTPSHLRGERSLEFIGRRPGYGTSPVAPTEDFEERY